mmetsp:Transcript_6411/g.12169  ORF Transcript_6411/g.12169 Transcript_6411/m.12169 type:complete len:313 (-) Transcript_6411:436-1374(-)
MVRMRTTDRNSRVRCSLPCVGIHHREFAADAIVLLLHRRLHSRVHGHAVETAQARPRVHRLRPAPDAHARVHRRAVVVAVVVVGVVVIGVVVVTVVAVVVALLHGVVRLHGHASAAHEILLYAECGRAGILHGHLRLHPAGSHGGGGEGGRRRGGHAHDGLQHLHELLQALHQGVALVLGQRLRLQAVPDGDHLRLHLGLHLRLARRGVLVALLLRLLLLLLRLLPLLLLLRLQSLLLRRFFLEGFPLRRFDLLLLRVVLRLVCLEGCLKSVCGNLLLCFRIRQLDLEPFDLLVRRLQLCCHRVTVGGHLIY